MWFWKWCLPVVITFSIKFIFRTQFHLQISLDLIYSSHSGNVCPLWSETGGASDASESRWKSSRSGGGWRHSLSGHRAAHQVAEEINRKVANKVVVGLGLCLALYDITDIGKSFVFPGDSATHTKVLLWIFRIFMEEHAFMNDNSSDPVLKVLCH